jgi:hypothetical protein
MILFDAFTPWPRYGPRRKYLVKSVLRSPEDRMRSKLEAFLALDDAVITFRGAANG